MGRREASAAGDPSTSPAAGAKKRDYPWTVLVVDPLAFPLVRLFARTRWLTPDQVTLVSLALGLPVGVAYGLGTTMGLIAGALLFYLSFVFDCVDGKLARILSVASPRGRALDALADGARRSSAVIGLGVYFFRTGRPADLLWVVVFGVSSFYFMEISGDRRDSGRAGGRWARAMARHRLLPTPGMPDVSAVAFVIGPVTGLLIPGLALGTVMVCAGILVTVRRRLRVEG